MAAADDTTGPAPGWRIATIGGVPVYIGRSWPIIALIIVATFGPGVASSRPDLGLGAYALYTGECVAAMIPVSISVSTPAAGLPSKRLCIWYPCHQYCCR